MGYLLNYYLKHFICSLIKNNSYFENSNICKSSWDIHLFVFITQILANIFFYPQSTPKYSWTIFKQILLVKFLLIKCE